MSKSVLRAGALALSLGLQALGAVGAAGLIAPAASAAAGPLVKIDNFAFSTPVLSVRAGTTVTWVNDDDDPHTVTAVDHSFKSKVLDTGDRFSVTFSKPGSFAYFCSLHPHMVGKVVVTA